MHRLEFRDVAPEDMDLIYGWSNDEIVRQASFYPNVIEYDEHKEWFVSRLNDRDSIMLIFLVENHPSGLVRFQIKGSASIIGILVAPEYRGRGLAATMLLEACNHFHSKHSMPIEAYIKKENRSSIRSFEKAGFNLLKEGEVNAYPCFIYILEKDDK